MRKRNSSTKRDFERRSKCKSVLLQLKQQSHCFCCGVSDWRVLDFHHHWQTKSFDMHEAVKNRRTAEALMTEVEKCFVLCANCHRICHVECEV
jgi:hypothetical protein